MPYKGAPMSYKGAPMSYKGALMPYKGALMSYKGAPMSYKGAPMSYKGPPMSYKGAPMPHIYAKEGWKGGGVAGAAPPALNILFRAFGRSAILSQWRVPLRRLNLTHKITPASPGRQARY